MKKTTLELLYEKIEESKRLFSEMDSLYEQIVKENKESKKLWTVKQTASFLNISLSTVTKGYQSGAIPYRQIVGSIRFDPDEIKQLGVFDSVS